MADLADQAWDRVRGKLPPRPYFVVTCMDPRIDIARVLGIDILQTNIIRNAGGRVTDDVIRSLLVAHTLMDTREVIVMQHTGCGMLMLDNDEFRAVVASRSGADVSDLDFRAIDELKTTARSDAATIRQQAALPEEVKITPCIYHLEDDRLEKLSD